MSNQKRYKENYSLVPSIQSNAKACRVEGETYVRAGTYLEICRKNIFQGLACRGEGRGVVNLFVYSSWREGTVEVWAIDNFHSKTEYDTPPSIPLLNIHIHFCTDLILSKDLSSRAVASPTCSVPIMNLAGMVCSYSRVVAPRLFSVM
jgi:hypothetical protein